LKKILIFLLFVFILSGCATYKFKKSGPAGNQGYLVTYDDESILEYTVGENKTFPDMELAKERFKRRKAKVEYYYKKMGLIEGRLKEVFWDPAAMIFDFLGGVLRWPVTAVQDYKYNHNPKYKERMDKLDEEKDALENVRINSVKEKLDTYIAQDLAKESSPQKATKILLPVVSEPKPEIASVVQEPLAETPVSAVVEQVPAQVVTPVPLPTKVVRPPVKIKPVVKKAPEVKIPEPPVAIIDAKPIRGYSPLTVNFSGQKSYSKSGKIVSYEWDFGDGDTSDKKNPKNIYWSTTYGSRNFTATLTVKDDKGLTSSTTLVIEVLTQ